MAHISLKVATAVIEYVRTSGQRNSRQIAFRDFSAEFNALKDASEKKRVLIPVNGVFELSVGDIGAMWPSHQTENFQADDFDSIYELLARRPDRWVRFSW